MSKYLDADVVMAKFDNLVGRLKDVLGEMKELTPHIGRQPHPLICECLTERLAGAHVATCERPRTTFDIEEYIRSLAFSANTSTEARMLVAGNLRALYRALTEKAWPEVTR